MTSTTDYHEVVAAYYNSEADSFEKRAGENHVLETLRGRFRSKVLELKPTQLLEIGYGPGLDLTFFADQSEIEAVYGLDIAEEFCKIAQSKAELRGDGKIRPKTGHAEQIGEIWQGVKVDTVYVFFGALNTTKNLSKAAEEIHSILGESGKIVITFVNKWYLFDVVWNLITLRWSKAFARFKAVWTGYSPTRDLPSKCWTSREVHKAFKPRYKRIHREGYCITHPAWYRKQWAPKDSIRSKSLYLFDKILQYTPFWNLGEYSLYVYEKK